MVRKLPSGFKICWNMLELAGPSTSVQAATMATEKRRFLDATVDESDAFIRKPSAVRATHFESGRMDTRWTIRDCIPAAIYRFGYCAVLQYPEVLMKSNTESKIGLGIYIHLWSVPKEFGDARHKRTIFSGCDGTWSS